MNRLSFEDVTTPDQAPAQKAAEILSAAKGAFIKMALVMAVLVVAAKYYLG